MVKPLAFVLVLALAGTAAAEAPYIPDDPPETSDDLPTVSRFGFRIALGGLPLDHVRTFVFALGLGIEHPLVGHFRALAEYDWMWTEGHVPVMDAPPSYGDGHRLQLGIRHELLGKRLRRAPLKLWVDGELGGGAALVTNDRTGVHTVPDGFVGLRFGYDMRTRAGVSPSRTFVAEISARAVVVPDGIGSMFGIGMYWGD